MVVVAGRQSPRPRTNAFYGEQFLPAYQKQFGERPISVFNAHACDAFNILAEGIKRAATDDGGTLTIPRTKLKDEVYKTSNFKGLSGTITCTPTGDCATAVSIAVYKVPDWPIEGGTENPKPVFTETKTLRGGLGLGSGKMRRGASVSIPRRSAMSWLTGVPRQPRPPLGRGCGPRCVLVALALARRLHPRGGPAEPPAGRDLHRARRLPPP